MSSGKDDSSEDEGNKKWNGDSAGLEDFDKKVARWCRRKYGTEVGNFLWENDVPDIAEMDRAALKTYCEKVWDGINDVNTTAGKTWLPRDSGFWTSEFQIKWVKKQYDRIYDYVEANIKGAAALEVETLGMRNARELKKHLTKHFGGSGDDVRGEEDWYEDGLPEPRGGNPCPNGFDMSAWLRKIQAKRVQLLKMCVSSKRDQYEMGKESKSVKIVMKCLKNTIYQADVDALIQEIKMKRNLEARLPKLSADGVLELPTDVEDNEIVEDWDYRNFSDDWLPKWEELKSKLISSWKSKSFGSSNSTSKKSGQLPVMLTPGFGKNANPKAQCFACGEYGHRRGDAICKAQEGAWHACAPPKFREKVDSPGGGKKRNAGVSGFTGKGGDGVCFAFRDTGKCKFGQNCKYKHESGSSSKKVKLTKADKKGITVAAVKTLAKKIKKNAKEKDGKDLDDEELRTYIASFCFVKTIPRECSEVLEIEIPALATSDLIDMNKHACYDSGSGTGITTERDDMVWVNDSKQAKDSVRIRGPSVGAPGCEGRGALVYRKELDGVPYGVIHPDGVLASPSVGFRIASERLLGQDGLRFIGGEFNQGCKLQCVRTKMEVPMETEDNILVLGTKGKASEIID